MSEHSLVEMVDEELSKGTTTLPVPEGSATRVLEMLRGGEFSVTDLEAILERDVTLATELLRVANSSFYCGLEKVATVRDAMMRLGSRKTASVLLMLCQEEQYRVHDPRLQEFVNTLWNHAVACAVGAEWLAKQLRLPNQDEAMLAGLFHDAGKLLVVHVIDRYLKERAPEEAQDLQASVVLQAVAQLHVWAGAHLLAEWNLPQKYISVVECHHRPEFDEGDTLLLLVRLVDQVANHIGIGLEPCPEAAPAGTPEALALGLSEVQIAELEVVMEDALSLA